MFRLTRTQRWILRPRSRGVAFVAALGAIALAAAPAAAADVSATNGMLTISTPGPVMTGVATTYTLTVTNTDPSSQPATSIQAGVQLPAGMTLNRLSPGCQRSTNPTLGGAAFSCGWAGPLGAGQSVSTTFTATASSQGNYVDEISGTLGFGAPTSASPPQFVEQSSLSYSIPVSPGPTDIQVTGSSTNGSPPVGSGFSYAFQVKDNGPQAAYGVTFDDPLPASLTALGVTSNNGSCTVDPSTNSVHCDIGLLGVGGQSNIVISAVAKSTGTVTNTASIAMLGPDTKPANNSVGVTVSPK